MYQLYETGRITGSDGNILITVGERYRKALKHLDQFSHIHIFYVGQEEKGQSLRISIVRILSIDGKAGSILAAGNREETGSNVLLDIKPYFPCEDSVKGADIHLPASDRFLSITQGTSRDLREIPPIGTIRNTRGEIYIQMEELPEMAGTYVKVIWWFHRFDKKEYRKATECNPPYEDAPRTGIFASRSPVRPNPLAMTVARVLRIEKEQKRIYLNAMECFDKTPCLGVFAYSADRDCITECSVPKWLEHWPQWVEDTKAYAAVCQDSGLVRLLQENGQAVRGRTGAVPEDTKPERETDAAAGNRPEGICIRGAAENTLKGINVCIPYRKITAVVGVSGSGKSSLVNDTIYTECRRRMEYLSHNRNLMRRPDMESMTGCIPAVMISQKPIRGNSQSTAGTYTNAYDYLRILYSNASVRHCPDCGYEIIPLSKERILSLVNAMNGDSSLRITDLERREIKAETAEEAAEAALEAGKGAFYIKPAGMDELLLQTRQKCYRCDKVMFDLTPQTFSYINAESRCPVCNGTGWSMEIDERKIIECPEKSLLDGASSFYGRLRAFLARPNANWMKGQVFGLADKMKIDLELPWEELPGTFRDILLYGSEETVTFTYDNKKNGRKGQISRPVEGICQIIKRVYSENTDAQALDKYMSRVSCPDCKGERLAGEGRMASIGGIRYPQAAAMTFDEIVSFCDRLPDLLSADDYRKIVHPVRSLRETAVSAGRLGIGYLKLDRETAAVSGGEGQRIKLLSALLNHMTGILYVFDEPSRGLHPRDYGRIAGLLQELKSMGNTILMVEHNEDMIRIADNLIELGPGAGSRGGSLVGEGSFEVMLENEETQICRYMRPYMEEVVRAEEKVGHAGENVPHSSESVGYAGENVPHVGAKVWHPGEIAGYSGENVPHDGHGGVSSSFVTMEHLTYRNLKDITVTFPEKALTCICGVSGSGKSSLMKGEIYGSKAAARHFSEVILADQLPIGSSSRSVIATYIGIMDHIREAFSLTKQAQDCGYTEAHFSFNGEQGQCAACKGEGMIRLNYMDEASAACPDCGGKRYGKEILKITCRDKNIDEILNMPAEEALCFWQDNGEIVRRLEILKKVGLGYLKIGQGTPSLSGGEASRLKLSKELMRSTGNCTLYLLDEPTTGLHFSDIEHLLALIGELIRNGNTVIAIEHNKQFLDCCDWVLELGPGAGADGGEIVRMGRNSF